MMKKILLPILLGIVMVACSIKKPYELVDGYMYIQKPERADKDWRLIWHEEFRKRDLDLDKWSKILPNEAEWGKYMTGDPRCFHFEDGTIHLIGLENKDSKADPRPYLTGGITTKGKFAFQYGKIEIRAKLKNARGAWPAIWMLAEKERYGKYPRNGEIDIMEHLNFDTLVYQTTHSFYTLELGEKDNPPHFGKAAIDTAGFNTFGLVWLPDKLVFSVNGDVTFTYPKVDGVDPSQWPYDQPFYLMIDQQLGGSWVGPIDNRDLPVSMIVDWVKVYQ